MNAERIGGFFWLLFGCTAAYGGWGLGLGTMQEPGSGFLTFVAGTFVSLMALLVIVHSFKGDPAAQARVSDLWKGAMWWRAIAITGLILLFIFSFETIGFFVCSFLLLVIIMRWLEGLAWMTCLLIPTIATVTTYIVFKTMMKISLPAGVFGF